MTYPSVKTLKQAFGDKALNLRKILDGRKDPLCYPDVADQVSRRCFNKPNNVELKLMALDLELEGFRVEAVWGENSELQPRCVYVNMGDTYDSTIVYDYEIERFYVTCIGDYIEKLQSKGVRFK